MRFLISFFVFLLSPHPLGWGKESAGSNSFSGRRKPCAWRLIGTSDAEKDCREWYFND